jgi:hypothetical protein
MDAQAPPCASPSFVQQVRDCVHKHRPLLQGVPCDLEDVVQEAIILHLDPGRLAERTCRSVAGGYFKRKHRGHWPVELQDAHDRPAPGAQPDDLAAEAERRKIVVEEIGKLSRLERDAVSLRYFESLTFQQISDRLQLRNRQQAERLCRSARSKLKKALRRCEAPDNSSLCQ